MIKIGTRGSALALWQAEYIANLIGKNNCEIIVIKTKGDKLQNISFDKIEGKGFFTKEIETALLEKQIDLAVHSMKDLPVEDISGLKIAAVTKREDPSDILLINEKKINTLSNLYIHDNAVIGTSSLRRVAQIKYFNNNYQVKALRGNVPTRIKKLRNNEYDAIIIANAGIKRLNIDLSGLKVITLPLDKFLPAPAQGALALQVRVTDNSLSKQLLQINDENSLKEVKTERYFLQKFGGGCHIPIGAYAKIDQGNIILSGSVTAVDGSIQYCSTQTGEQELETAEKLANYLIKKGADKLI